MITHVAVYSGFEDVEVVQERPECTIPCARRECLTFEFENVCPEGEVCYSIIPQEGHFGHAAACKASQSTGEVGTHCCEGTPQTYDLIRREVGQWGRIVEDANQAKAACSAFGLDGSVCASINGTNAQIKSIDEENRTVRVWSPALYAVENDDDKSTITMPFFSVYIKPARKEYLNVSRADLKKIMVDFEHGFITSKDGVSDAVQLPPYWFVNMMTATASLSKEDKTWFSYQPFRWAFEQTTDFGDENYAQFYQVRFSDEEVNTTTCTSDDQWRDAKGYGCEVYDNSNWCTIRGLTTEAFFTNYTEFAALTGKDRETALYMVPLSSNNTNGFAPPWVCCSCGGGYHAIPSEVPSSETSQFFFK